MAATTFTTALSIGELEANYALYCKAMRTLILEGVQLEKVKRTVCWSRLSSLHSCMPRHYRHPEQLFFLLSRQLNHASND
jgi:hypothetical protein